MTDPGLVRFLEIVARELSASDARIELGGKVPTDERLVFRMAPKRFRQQTVIPVLLELPRVKIAKAWQTLAIGSADIEVAEHLGIPVNTAVAEVRRVCTAPDGTGAM